MRRGKLHIGTSGWSYKDWKGTYYPEKMKSTEWLGYYAREFDCTEVNTSFYHLPRPQTPVKWTEQVPKNFKFCVKISRYITHIKRLAEPEATLPKFLDVFDPVKKHLGPVLVQLPPSLRFDKEKAKQFFSALKTYKGYNFALEVRHESWLSDESYELMKQYKAAFVISQSGVGFPYAEEVTAKHIYIRFHGPGELYKSAYTASMLGSYADKIDKWLNDGHEVWAFFNNDWYLNAIYDAKKLRDMLTGKNSSAKHL